MDIYYDVFKRYKQYPKGSILLYSIVIPEFRIIEKKWIVELNKCDYIKNKNEIGKEYFEGYYIIIINILTNIIYRHFIDKNFNILKIIDLKLT